MNEELLTEEVTEPTEEQAAEILAETLQETDRPLLTTSFDDYTVTEGLLLILVLLLFLSFCGMIVRRGFSWL